MGNGRWAESFRDKKPVETRHALSLPEKKCLFSDKLIVVTLTLESQGFLEYFFCPPVDLKQICGQYLIIMSGKASLQNQLCA